MRYPTSEASDVDVDVTGSRLLMQTTFRSTYRWTKPSRTSPTVTTAIPGRTQNSNPYANYSPMIGLRWEYSPMVGIKIAAVLGGFFLLFAAYSTLKGVVRCSRRDTEDFLEDTSSEEGEGDGKRSEEELDVVESRLDWDVVSAAKRGADDGVQSVSPEMRSLSPHPLSQYLGRLHCSVDIPECEGDGNRERTDSRTYA